MYLSDCDLRAAIENGQLIVDPFERADPTSIDLRLDSVDEAKIWDVDKLAQDNKAFGHSPRELHIARMHYGTISRKYLVSPPSVREASESTLVFRRDDHIVLRPDGY